MLIASYIATRPGFQGLMNRLIRRRFGGKFFSNGEASHCEVVFEPSDDVGHLMPDGTCAPDANGALWCASASAADHMPEWSLRRVGKVGGVRFKRINVQSANWELSPYPRDPLKAAKWFNDNEGKAYDWGSILGFFSWFFSFAKAATTNRWVCSSAVAASGGYLRPDLYHPALMRSMFGSKE